MKKSKPVKKNKPDPILLSVLQRRLKSITGEMGLTLLRTTRSPILNEARDFVTGLYDAKGRMLEQTEYIPVLAFDLPRSWQLVLVENAELHVFSLARLLRSESAQDYFA